jgi:hypothetical protein
MLRSMGPEYLLEPLLCRLEWWQRSPINHVQPKLLRLWKPAVDETWLPAGRHATDCRQSCLAGPGPQSVAARGPTALWHGVVTY